MRKSANNPRALRWGTLAVLTTAAAVGASIVFNRATKPPTYKTPEDGTITNIGGRRVFHRHWAGPVGARPLVLLPGYAESSAVYLQVGELLAQHYEVYALDLPGAGYTQGNSESRSSQVELVMEWMRQCAILETDKHPAPVILGHSMGAAVTGGIALEHPEQVAGIIFADGDALPMPDDSGSIPQWVVNNPIATSVYRLLTRYPRLMRLAIKNSVGSAGGVVESEAWARHGRQIVQQWLTPLSQGVVEGDLLNSLAQDEIISLEPEQVRAITVPRGIIWGDEDENVVNLEATRENLGNPPEIIIRGAGHLSMLADPQAFSQAVHDLVQTIVED